VFLKEHSHVPNYTYNVIRIRVKLSVNELCSSAAGS
jgi:hypothetical protein